MVQTVCVAAVGVHDQKMEEVVALTDIMIYLVASR